MKEGQVSGLIRNTQGIHILYLEEIQKKDRKPLKDVREEIIRALLDSRSDLVRKRQMEIEKKLNDKTAIQWHEAELDSLTRLLANRNIYNRNAFLFALDSLTIRQKELVVAKYCDGSYTVQNLLKHASERLSPYTQNDFSNKNELKTLIQHWLITDQIVDLAYRKRMDRDKGVVDQTRVMIENAITRKMIQKEFSDRAKADPDSIRAFYEREKDKRYTEPEKLVIQEILVDSKELADRLYQLALTGKDFGKLAEENTIRPTYRTRKGIFPEMEKGSGGILGEAGFSMKPGEISKPISGEQGRFSIIKVLQKKGVVLNTYDSVKDRVSMDYIENRREALRSFFLSKKKSEFGGVQILNRVLERYFDAK
jgi:parvulin-like peptidyl-prolyl isomerase